ncbi:MAG: hypothetical protein ACRDL8_12985, partial [Solirubrobacteraceae bacterium]
MNLLFAALLLLPSLASAQAWRSYFKEAPAAAAAAPAATSCQRLAPVMIGGTQGYADVLDGGRCFVSIHPNAATMVYRDYALFDDGMLMVFSSYGEGEGPTMTSAREYYFFPRTGALRLEMNASAGTVSVAMMNGGRASFDPATAQLSALDRGTVTVSPRVDRDERGGVEISDYQGLMLDAGFRLGELPSGRPDADSTFRSAEGQLCTVKNRELFDYKGYDHQFKFDDAALSAWLKTRCPG